MAQWLPQSWRQALTRLREDIDRAFERGFRRRRGGERDMQAKADDAGVMVDIGHERNRCRRYRNRRVARSGQR